MFCECDTCLCPRSAHQHTLKLHKSRVCTTGANLQCHLQAVLTNSMQSTANHHAVCSFKDYLWQGSSSHLAAACLNSSRAPQSISLPVTVSTPSCINSPYLSSCSHPLSGPHVPAYVAVYIPGHVQARCTYLLTCNAQTCVIVVTIWSVQM